MSRIVEFLSLGAGVQSTAVLLMSCRGELPRLDAAVFADTQWEPAAVYDHLGWLQDEAKKHGIPVHIVTKGDLREHTMAGLIRGSASKGERYASMPLRVLNDGRQGMMQRQCTKEYKIEPVERALRRVVLGLKPGQRMPKDIHVRHWFGISADETRRMRMSRHRWQTNCYPLVLKPDNDPSAWRADLWRARRRHHCLEWLREADYPKPPRSACIGCPYRSNAEWRALTPEEFEDACLVDETIRKSGGERGELFLHRDCVPLRDADLRTPEERGQLNWIDECQGMCGV